jgi:nitronate monooxygenase
VTSVKKIKRIRHVRIKRKRYWVLKIGNFIIRIPIVQGGMGVGISLACLAAAMANEGGVGVISAADVGMNEPDFSKNPSWANMRALRKEIRRARALTKGVLGVNIMVALEDFEYLAKVAIEEGIDIIFFGAGLSFDLPKLLEGTGKKTALVPIVSSARAANIIAQKWFSKFGRVPDAVVVEGPKAGGHLGFKEEQILDSAFALEKLVPEVIAAMRPFEEKLNKPIPIIAAGGIYTGADIKKFLRLGASGVQMATRFVTTYECDASDKFKQAYINAKEEDLVIIKSPVGLPGRAIKNEFLDDVTQGKKTPIKCVYHCLKTCKPKESPYCISHALINAKKGNLKLGFVFAGTNAYRAKRLYSIHRVVKDIKKEYQRATGGKKL